MLRNSMSRLVICILLILGAPSVNAGEADHRDRNLRVMTRNMDLGSDFGYIFEVLATTPNDSSALLLAITRTYLEVLASHIPQRADALAAEIQTTQPDLVALQEVSTVSTGPFGAPATTVVEDQLDDLLDALDQRGLHYAPVTINKNADVTLPSLDPSFQHLVEVRLVDSDVVLARTDLPVSEFKLEKLQKGNFAALVLSIADERHFLPADRYRCEAAERRPVRHHAPETFSPAGRADEPNLSGPLNTDRSFSRRLEPMPAPSFANGPAYACLSAGFLMWNISSERPGAYLAKFGEDPPLGPTSPLRELTSLCKRQRDSSDAHLRTEQQRLCPITLDCCDFTLFPGWETA